MRADYVKLFILLSLICAYTVSCSFINAIGTEHISDMELVDTVLTKDAILSGEITIKGSLIVKKSANLTIEPGTVIKFKRVYVDDDEISDSEIVVEGSITAIGTKDKRIIFTSGENEPKAADWKFLMINFARESVIKYCTVEYAYSGVQVHFTRATVSNSVFRYNFDGVRFSTARISVTDNEIYGNVNGIRYEERGAAAIITRNNIYKNKVGIFCVIKSNDMSRIFLNNISNNADYNVKLGIKQSSDITMTNNFWGTADESKIGQKIFDKSFDDTLGKVRFFPYLKSRILQ